jgi:hypothetical protein
MLLPTTGAQEESKEILEDKLVLSDFFEEEQTLVYSIPKLVRNTTL